jgi:hypothetical protein
MVLFYCFNALRIGINLVRRESSKCVKTNLTRYRVYWLPISAQTKAHFGADQGPPGSFRSSIRAVHWNSPRALASRP